MMRRVLLPLLAVFSIVLPIHAEEQVATVLRDTQLHSAPYSDASVITTVKAKSRITILERRGGWYQVRDSRRHTGWLRMSNIRFGEGGTSTGDGSGLNQTLRFLSSGRSGASGVTVATGIRGLSSADVAHATPDHNAVKRLDRFSVSAAAAQSFALNANLRSKQIRYIKEPE